jgi:hypothetical protein
MDGGAEPTWRRRPWGPFYDTSFSQEHKATVNGVLYFLPSNTYSASHARNRIAAFDLESEEWKPEMIKCPPLQCKEDQWHMSVSLKVPCVWFITYYVSILTVVAMSTYGS